MNLIKFIKKLFRRKRRPTVIDLHKKCELAYKKFMRQKEQTVKKFKKVRKALKRTTSGTYYGDRTIIR